MVVGPHSNRGRETYTTVVDRTRQVRIAALENANTVSELLMTVRLKLPTLGLSGTWRRYWLVWAANGAFTANGQQRSRRHKPPWTGGAPERRCSSPPSTPLVGTVWQQPGRAGRFARMPPRPQSSRCVALPNTSRAMTMTILVLRPVEVRSVFPPMGRSSTTRTQTCCWSAYRILATPASTPCRRC